MTKQGYLGIDAGTQGLSVVFTDAQLNVVATGVGDYAMLPELEEGSYEQNPQDWLTALKQKDTTNILTETNNRYIK